MIMGSYREFLKDQGIKKWDIIAVDYAAGRDFADKFKGLVTSQGGTIGKTLFAPFGTPDFGAKISELGAEPADGLFVTIFGSDAIDLAKQQQQFGLFKKYKMVLGNSFVIRNDSARPGRHRARRLSEYWLRGRFPGRAG